MKSVDFIRECAEASGMTMKDTKIVLKAIGDVVMSHMNDEDGVTPFPGLKLYSVFKEARTGRNPSTGEAVEIAAKYQPKARFGKAVKDAINL